VNIIPLFAQPLGVITNKNHLLIEKDIVTKCKKIKSKVKKGEKFITKNRFKKVSKEISEEKILGSKFTLSLQTMIAAGTGLASLIGMWYALQADIQEAKELPVPVSLFSQEYPSKGISDYNWSPSYEQYKQQISQLQNDNDEIFETMEELQQEISILKQQVIDLRIKVR